MENDENKIEEMKMTLAVDHGRGLGGEKMVVSLCCFVGISYLLSTSITRLPDRDPLQ